ncbi:MAG: PH domain-containing protein [Candidatus Howiella sp.]|jgi:membrane protein YdbS with pleckstrin-like domain
MTFRPPKNALTLFRTYAMVLLAGVFVLCAFLGLALPKGITATLFALLIFLAVFLWFYYLPRLMESMAVRLSGDALVYTRGVFIRRRYIMPKPRMIYVEQFYTPFSAALGLCSLRLRASKGRLTIPCLSEQEAAAIIRATGNDVGGGQNRCDTD